jgi:hypothetical protein
MDVSFGINDVKFHLFILMVFWFTLDWDPNCMDCHFLANMKWFDKIVSPIKN